MAMIYQGGRMLILNDAQIQERVAQGRRALLAGAAGFAERKRKPVTYVAPPRPRREWPVVTSVECGLRRHDNRFAEAAAHLAKAERAKEDGQAALRESRRTLARAWEERDFAERRWRRALRLLAQVRGWAAVAAGLSLVGGIWGAAALAEMFSKPLAAVIAGCAFVVALLEVERAGKRRRG